MPPLSCCHYVAAAGVSPQDRSPVRASAGEQWPPTGPSAKRQKRIMAASRTLYLRHELTSHDGLPRTPLPCARGPPVRRDPLVDTCTGHAEGRGRLGESLSIWTPSITGTSARHGLA